MALNRVAILTAGGFAPCLSSAVGGLIERYTEIDPEIEILVYEYGYYGLLKGQSILIDQDARDNAGLLHRFGGSAIGNSRVKLTNAKDCEKRGLVGAGENPLQVAAEQLKKDGVDILHTIGGDDTNTTAADLAAYLEENQYHLTVVGLPKTIDNDIVPVAQSLGALTAAEEAAEYAVNIIGEHRSSPRMLIIHEVMGRACGYLTARAAADYREWVERQKWVPSIGLTKERWDIHAIYLPEMDIDLKAEGERLKAIMDEQGNVNIFLSEGAGVDEILEEMEAAGEEIPRDAFGHVKLDLINPGQWFAKRFKDVLGAEKVMVQKSGYYSRAARAREEDLRLIKSMTDYAVECAMRGEAGLIGHDEEDGGRLKAIKFDRVAGHKPFNMFVPWFEEVMETIGQPLKAD